ncbi:hypothetical protein [Georgenia subflava]|uniref:hypothetical protein n=1 Tax=Georgenia subflava TaxID=1622177 RepID=UPI001D023426|nr:hypothetical protein [Georgenia subflava]
MSTPALPVLAGAISTLIFVASYVPMLVKAVRSRDLSSYSTGHLALATIGNLIHSLYIFSLPVGPIWLLHSFYLISTALMLVWYRRFRLVNGITGSLERVSPSGDDDDMDSVMVAGGAPDLSPCSPFSRHRVPA